MFRRVMESTSLRNFIECLFFVSAEIIGDQSNDFTFGTSLTKNAALLCYAEANFFSISASRTLNSAIFCITGSFASSKSNLESTASNRESTASNSISFLRLSMRTSTLLPKLAFLHSSHSVLAGAAFLSNRVFFP